MSELPHPSSSHSSGKPRPLWRPLESLGASAGKPVFAGEPFTHKKSLLFTLTVHEDEGQQGVTLSAAEVEQPLNNDTTEHTQTNAFQDGDEKTSTNSLNLEEVRAQAFAEGLAQGLESAQKQAHQAQQTNQEMQLQSQLAEQTQILLHSIEQKVEQLIEDPSLLQEPLKRLALHLAEQLVLSELTLSPQAIEHLIERCVQTLDASDSAALVVELNAQDLALLQSVPRDPVQPSKAWRMQVDHALLPGSVRVRADDTVVSDLIENRLESLANSMLKDPTAWRQQSAFAPSKLATRLASQRGSADTVEDAQAKPYSPKSSSISESNSGLNPESTPRPQAFSNLEDAESSSISASVSPAQTHHEAEDGSATETPHADTLTLAGEDDARLQPQGSDPAVDRSSLAAEQDRTQKFSQALNDISLELDQHND